MEIGIAYLALCALLAAIAGLFIPQKLVFWCALDDRTRTMAFTVYFSLAIVLGVVFVVAVPEPTPKPVPVHPIETKLPTPQPKLTRPIFLKEVTSRLAKQKGFKLEGMEFTLLDFGKSGASAQLTFADKPHRKIAVQHATQVVQAMNATFKAYHWKLTDPILVTCQVHTWEQYSGLPKGHRSMGFARYMPKNQKIKWLDYN